VDAFAWFDDLGQRGLDVRGDGSLVLTTRYLGGVFSLDGIHPTRTGHAYLANVLIGAINAGFGEAIPPVDVIRVAQRDPLVRHRRRPTGEAPFGVIDEDSIALEDDLNRVRDAGDDVLDALRDKIGDVF